MAAQGAISAPHVAALTGGRLDVVANQLRDLVAANPTRAREFTTVAAPKVRVVYFTQVAALLPPPTFSRLADARRVAQQRGGIFEVHHVDVIALWTPPSSRCCYAARRASAGRENLPEVTEL